MCPSFEVAGGAVVFDSAGQRPYPASAFAVARRARVEAPAMSASRGPRVWVRRQITAKATMAINITVYWA
jgi:hypothetical protein